MEGFFVFLVLFIIIVVLLSAARFFVDILGRMGYIHPLAMEGWWPWFGAVCVLLIIGSFLFLFIQLLLRI